MGCSLGKAKYKPLPVDDPSHKKVGTPAHDTGVHATSAPVPRPIEAEEGNRSVSERPHPKNLMEAFGLGHVEAEETPGPPSQASAVEALGASVRNVAHTSEKQVVLHDADDAQKGIFADFAHGAPDVRVDAGQVGSKVSPHATGFASRSPDSQRLADYISSLKDLSNDNTVLQGIGCFIRWCVKPLLLVLLAYVWVGKKLYAVYLLMPANLVKMFFGLALCLFGGVYFAAIAAVEAAINLGGADMLNHLTVCWEEGSRIAEASRKDDLVDEDGDGTADVLSLPYHELALRKAKVAMIAVRKPDRLQQAVVSLFNVYIAVIATLKFQFAKTVAVALGIANMLTLPATHLFAPLLSSIMGKELNHWIPAIIDTGLKIVAVMFASWLQAFISAFYSALRGGRLFAEGLLNICSENGLMDKLPDCLTSKPFNPDECFLDEGIAYPLAAVGFYLQVSNGFSLAFPFNIALLPLTCIEYLLRFQVYT